MAQGTVVAPTIEAVRSQFPTLGKGCIYLENAGGSQVPRVVADAIRDYMLTNYVQLGAEYGVSQICTQVVADAHEFAKVFMGAERTGQAIIGPSTTQLVTMLAECYSRALEPGDEIVIAETGHEANVGPWQRLERLGVAIKWWKVDPASRQCPLDGLADLLSPRTRIVAFPHVSNLLGEIVDVAAITRVAHQVGARVVVDAVAYAPHRAIRFDEWDVDWYVYSTYKVFGPHMSVMCGKKEAFDELKGPNHFFVPNEDPYKFELGGPSHEGCAAFLALRQYLGFLAGDDRAADRETVERAFSVVTGLELPVQERLLRYLGSKESVTVIGPPGWGMERVPTMSFVSRRSDPNTIVAAATKRDIGIRSGHMYAYRLCQALGIDTESGVVRVSADHYNTLEEVDQLIEVFEDVV